MMKIWDSFFICDPVHINHTILLHKKVKYLDVSGIQIASIEMVTLFTFCLFRIVIEKTVSY